MGYSEKCRHRETYWNLTQKKCVPCDMSLIKPGLEFTPNCGYTDDGGRRVSRIQKCKILTFNDGRHGTCQTCSSCPRIARPCNNTTDTQCCEEGKDCDGLTVSQLGTPRDALWLAPIIVLICIMVGALSYFIYKRKRQCSQGPQVQSAPLRMVLDDLDVLDELIILLDPEGNGVKCTRHLASYCSFPNTWINYTYSMRDNKSPLKTVLEGVTTKHPDWTVGHLAQLLAEMGRNDAVIVLAKLKRNVDAVESSGSHVVSGPTCVVSY